MSRTASTSAPASLPCRSSARSARVTRVTPGRSATSGSTSWGRARSTTARRPLPSRPPSRWSRARPSSRCRRPRGRPRPARRRAASSAAARTPCSAARLLARLAVRLTTTTSATPRRVQRRGGEGSHRAGAHHDRPAAEDLADPVERGRHEGRRELVDGRLGVHALADPQGLLEQHVERRADRPGLLTAGAAPRAPGRGSGPRRPPSSRARPRPGTGARPRRRRSGRRGAAAGPRWPGRRARPAARTAPRRCRGSGRRRRRSRAGCRSRSPSPR